VTEEQRRQPPKEPARLTPLFIYRAIVKPDVVTLFYGMNDANRGIYVPWMKRIAEKLKAGRVPAIIVSPGAVDTYYGIRGGDRNFPVGFNKEQGLMGEEARKIAADNGLGFVDLHNPFKEAFARVDAIVLEKQKEEGLLIKNIIGGIPLPNPKPAADGTGPPAPPKPTQDEAIAQRTKLMQAARDAVQPVRHQIIITKAD
jgi:hypothetical protein